MGIASQGISEGVEDGCSMGHKTAVKIDKTEEALEMLGRGWQWMVANGGNMRREGIDASGSDREK